MIALKVREFEHADDLIAHYKAMKARQRYSPPPVAKVAALPAPVVSVAPVATVFGDTRHGRTIYAWPVGPRHKRDILYVATPTASKNTQAQQIIKEVAAKRGFSVNDIKSCRRQKALCLARHEIVYRMKTETGMSFPQMGRMLGRDHTTALNSLSRYTQLLAQGAV